MALSTTEIVLVLLLGVGLIIAIIVYITSHKQTSVISSQPYARGANASKAGNVLLTCDAGSVINVHDGAAILVCHDPTSDNFENPATDPFLTDGTPNPQTTVDLSKSLQDACNGKMQCTYSFTGIDDNFVCGTTGTPQLIATYTCNPPT